MREVPYKAILGEVRSRRDPRLLLVVLWLFHAEWPQPSRDADSDGWAPVPQGWFAQAVEHLERELGAIRLAANEGPPSRFAALWKFLGVTDDPRPETRAERLDSAEYGLFRLDPMGPETVVFGETTIDFGRFAIWTTADPSRVDSIRRAFQGLPGTRVDGCFRVDGNVFDLCREDELAAMIWE